MTTASASTAPTNGPTTAAPPPVAVGSAGSSGSPASSGSGASSGSPASSGSGSASEPTRRISHRYPWSLEERLILGACTLGPAALTACLWVVGGVAQQTALVLQAVGLGLAALLWRVGVSRKRRSIVAAELTGTYLRVVGGRVKASRGDIATTRAADVQVLGPEMVLALTGKDGVLRVPMRVAVHPALAPVLTEHVLRRPGVEVSSDARRLLEAL